MQEEYPKENIVMAIWGIEYVYSSFLLRAIAMRLHINWRRSDLKHISYYKKEYPRPQLWRENYQLLNGTWDFAFGTMADEP